MQKIENDLLIVRSKKEGAELCSIFNKETNLEYLWQAGVTWPKHAPVLFPIVGQLKDNIYNYDGKQFSMERHGFARTKTFNINSDEQASVEYGLTNSNETLAVYPFEFELKIRYELADSSLKIIYIVENKGKIEMLFSIGAHPAFKVPLINGESYDDYYLEFNKTENARRWMLKNGLLDNNSIPYLHNTKKLPLNKSLFYEDALVFKNLQSDVVSLKSKKSKHGLDFKFEKFPYFGIWAAKDADFICLEPWYGIADNINADQQLENKEGIKALLPGKEFTFQYSILTF